MSATELQDQYELQKAEEFIASTPRLDGVEAVRVELQDDWSGDPAMYLVFTVRRRDPDPNHEWIHRFIAYSDSIQIKIIHGGLKRFPYTRLEDAA